MSFDPNTVERYYDAEHGSRESSVISAITAPDGAQLYVLASDYDALLELYRELQRKCDVTLRQLHGAQHGNIHSPDDLCVENCPQCSELTH